MVFIRIFVNVSCHCIYMLLFFITIQFAKVSGCCDPWPTFWAYSFCCDVVLSMKNDVLSLQTIRDKCERQGFISLCKI